MTREQAELHYRRLYQAKAWQLAHEWVLECRDMSEWNEWIDVHVADAMLAWDLREAERQRNHSIEAVTLAAAVNADHARKADEAAFAQSMGVRALKNASMDLLELLNWDNVDGAGGFSPELKAAIAALEKLAKELP
jgi:hypothetical protein